MTRSLSVLVLASLMFPATAGGAEHVAAERYLVQGAPVFSPYQNTLALFDITDGHLKGILAPPKGDTRPAVPLGGTIENGVMKLNFGKGAEEYHLELRREERGGQIVWTDVNTIPGVDNLVMFRPSAGFSEAALVLQHQDDQWCGALLGGLSVKLRATDLRNMVEAPADLGTLNVVVFDAAGATSTLKLKDVWSRLRLAARAGKDVRFDIAVPVGSEMGVAERIRGLPAVAAVNLPDICRDTALVTVPRSRVMDWDKVSDAKLKSYLEGVLGRQLSGGDPKDPGHGTKRFEIADARVERNANGQPVFLATVIAASEATRLQKGRWDRFNLSIQPVVSAVDTAESVSLLVNVSDVTGAKRGGGAQVPAATAFQPQEDETLAAGIAQRIISWLATEEDTHCTFISDTGFEVPEDGLTCANPMPDEVAPHEDE